MTNEKAEEGGEDGVEKKREIVIEEEGKSEKKVGAATGKRPLSKRGTSIRKS